jgi:uncharacterized membrane protein
MTENNTPQNNDDKILAALCYLFPLIALVLFLMEDKKNNPNLRPHIAQALAMGVLLFALSFIPIIGWLADLVIAIYMILLAIKAYQGQEVVIPMVTDFVKNQGWA